MKLFEIRFRVPEYKLAVTMEKLSGIGPMMVDIVYTTPEETPKEVVKEVKKAKAKRSKPMPEERHRVILDVLANGPQTWGELKSIYVMGGYKESGFSTLLARLAQTGKITKVNDKWMLTEEPK